MRPANLAARQALDAVLRRGPLGIAAVASALGVSTRTALRLLNEAKERVVASGSAGRRRYALRHPLRGEVTAFPLYSVDAAGRVGEVAALSLIEPGGSHCALAEAGWPVDEASQDGLWDGLPYPVYDMQPQGFLGRSFARREHRLLEVSPDPREWGDDQIVFVLSRRGADTGGNLILGDLALQAFQHEFAQPAEPLAESQTAEAYAGFASDTVALSMAGSSAAGEFPKFTALREVQAAAPASATPHVIVKFSGRVDSATPRRWADLLVCEHLASLFVGGLEGVAAARSRILQAEGRFFLESERFDRHGRFGRSPLVSLQAIDGHLMGLPTRDWRSHVAELQRRGLLSAQDAAAVRRLWWFGSLIANGDMHLGNLSFVPEAGRLKLAPSYDMLPMAYAPLPGGEVPAVDWAFALPPPAQLDAWQQAATAAQAFWAEAAADARISEGFRSTCRDNGMRLARLADRL